MIDVGTTGDFTFTGPWEPLSGRYTLESVTAGKVLMSLSVDVYGSIFVANGLTEDDFNAWSDAEAIIYILTNGKDTLKIPDTYLTLNVTGPTTKFQQHFITIELGYLEASDVALLTDLKETLKNEVISTLGVNANVESTEYGPIKAVTDVDRDALVIARTDRKNSLLPGFPSRMSLIADKATNEELLSKFSDIIKNKILNP